MCWESRSGWVDAVQDKVGNTVIRKPAQAGRESAAMALLQGHLDMVCEKNEGTAHNFETESDQDGARRRLVEGRGHDARLR